MFENKNKIKPKLRDIRQNSNPRLSLQIDFLIT